MKFWDKRAHASCNIQLNYDGLLLSTLNLLIFDILSKCDLLFIICLFHSINNLFKREINLIRLIIHSAFFRFPYFLFQELVAISFAFSKNQFISFLLLSVIFFSFFTPHWRTFSQSNYRNPHLRVQAFSSRLSPYFLFYFPEFDFLPPNPSVL